MVLRIFIADYHLLVADVVESLELGGHEVVLFEPRQMAYADFKAAVEAHRPDCLLSINFAPPLAYLAGEFQLPYISWTIDPLPLNRLELVPETKLKWSLAFAHHQQWVDALIPLGLPCHYLPLSAPQSAFVPSEDYRPELQGKISFVGSSLRSEILAWKNRWKKRAAVGIVEQKCHRLLSAVDEEIRGGFAEIDFRVDEARYQRIAESWEKDAGVMSLDDTELRDWIGSVFSHRYRMLSLMQIPREKLLLYGDQGLEEFEECYRGISMGRESLSSIYRSSSVNLDLPRLYQREIATLRVFEVRAQGGGVLLTEECGDQAKLYEKLESKATYRSLDELRDWSMTRSLTKQEFAEEVALAQQITAQDHRLEQRLAEIWTLMAERFGKKFIEAIVA